MLDPGVKLGTPTPRADPSGDYAFEVFRKADAIRPGARAVLKKLALQLTRSADRQSLHQGAQSMDGISRRSTPISLLTYCTSTLAAQKENPEQQI